jgi:hypothetical protein
MVLTNYLHAGLYTAKRRDFGYRNGTADLEDGASRRCHSSALIMTTGVPPAESSSGRKPRPLIAFNPRIRRKRADTRTLFRTSGSDALDSVREAKTLDLPICVRGGVSVRQSYEISKHPPSSRRGRLLVGGNSNQVAIERNGPVYRGILICHDQPVRVLPYANNTVISPDVF